MLLRRELRLLLWAALIMVTLFGTLSCANLGYYARSTTGHLSLIAKRQPIPSLLRQPDLNPQLRYNLETVLSIRDFASRELQLPENGSYRSYVDIKRPYVVWNVVATPEFELRPLQWCFPVAGCVNYRGFFSAEEASSFARDLREQGNDVYLYGVTAYSTLGWFDDPVLSTFFSRSEEDLAGLIFHELAHQQIYLKGDSVFSESFAKAVEMEGVSRWLAARGESARIEGYLEESRRHEGFVDLVKTYQERLRDLYRQPLDPEVKRQGKEQVLADLRAAHETLKATWGGKGYDRWFHELNNAKIASMSTYYTHVPAFQALLYRHAANLSGFYQEVQEISRLPEARRLALLEGLRLEFVAGLPAGRQLTLLEQNEESDQL